MTEDTAVETPQRAWPKYESHKVVSALKLRLVEPDVAVGHTRFHPEDKLYAPLVYPDTFEVVKRCQAAERSDPGYLVLYEDGFLSWSPTLSFERGYTEMQPL